MVMEAHLNFVAHSHQFSNISIVVDGDTASSETYGDVTLRRIDEPGAPIDSRNLGRYVDRWERRAASGGSSIGSTCTTSTRAAPPPATHDHRPP